MSTKYYLYRFPFEVSPLGYPDGWERREFNIMTTSYELADAPADAYMRQQPSLLPFKRVGQVECIEIHYMLLEI